MKSPRVLFQTIATTALIVGSVSPHAAHAQEGQSLRDDLALSTLFLVPHPTENDSSNHGVKLPDPVTFTIPSGLPKPAHKGGLDVLYFQNGRATATEPGWTSYCQLARPSNKPTAEPGPTTLGQTRSVVQKWEWVATYPTRIAVTDTCWGPEEQQPPSAATYSMVTHTQHEENDTRTNQIGSPIASGRSGAPGEGERLEKNSLVDIRLGSGGVWAIECHNMSVSATVGDLKKIFGKGVSIAKAGGESGAVEFESAEEAAPKIAKPSSSSSSARAQKTAEPLAAPTPTPTDTPTTPPTTEPAPPEVAEPPLLPPVPAGASGYQFK